MSRTYRNKPDFSGKHQDKDNKGYKYGCGCLHCVYCADVRRFKRAKDMGFDRVRKNRLGKI